MLKIKFEIYLQHFNVSFLGNWRIFLLEKLVFSVDDVVHYTYNPPFLGTIGIQNRPLPQVVHTMQPKVDKRFLVDILNLINEETDNCLRPN